MASLPESVRLNHHARQMIAVAVVTVEMVVRAGEVGPAVLNFFVNMATNAGAESFNAKVKAFRAQFRGVSDIPFFLFRLMKLCA